MIITSCDPSNINSNSQSASFFDLKKYFSKEVLQLESIKSIEKSVEINGNIETKQLSNIDFSKELSAFSDSDINRLSWVDKYSVDSIYDNNSGELKKLKYIAQDKEMKTQLLVISFEEKFVDSIIIENSINGFATKSKKFLTYAANLGYTIESTQSTLLGSNQRIVVDVRFTK